MPFVDEMYLNEKCYFQQDGMPLYYHKCMNDFINVYLPGRRDMQSIHPISQPNTTSFMLKNIGMLGS
jgi:hypothetical protein